MSRIVLYYLTTSKGGSRRAEKSRKVLMMMKAAKLGWAGAVKNGGSQMALVLSEREVGRGVNVISVTRSLIMIMLL